MVSLLEQYETEIQTPVVSNTSENHFRTGFIQASMNTADNEDIFKSQRVQIKYALV